MTLSTEARERPSSIKISPRQPCPPETVVTEWGHICYLAGPEPTPPKPAYFGPQVSWPKEGDYQSQDYLCVRHNRRKVVFTVCDGVGKSFAGQLAAGYLAKGLTDQLWIADTSREFGQASQFKEKVAAYLTESQPEASQIVEDADVLQLVEGDPTRVPEQIKRREQHGSHTVFACGRVDFAPQHLQTGQILLAWMGNVRIRLHHGEDWEDIVAGTLDDENRWTTKDGMRGTLSVWEGRVEDVDQIVVYTDGLAGLDEVLKTGSPWFLDKEALWEAATRFSSLTSDDYTLLEFALRLSPGREQPGGSAPNTQAESATILSRSDFAITMWIMVYEILLYYLIFIHLWGRLLAGPLALGGVIVGILWIEYLIRILR